MNEYNTSGVGKKGLLYMKHCLHIVIRSSVHIMCQDIKMDKSITNGCNNSIQLKMFKKRDRRYYRNR